MVSKMKKEYDRAIMIIKKFDKLYMRYSPVHHKVPISSWDIEIIKEYYKLKKELKLILKSNNKIYNLVKRLPLFACLLGKYVFETVFVISHIILLTIYIIKVPVFKGMLPFYVTFVFLSFFFARERLKNMEDDISYLLGEIKREILEEIKYYTKKT